MSVEVVNPIVASWKTTNLEDQLKEVKLASKRAAYAHMQQSDYYNLLNLRMMVALACFGVFSTGVVAFMSQYYPELGQFRDVFAICTGLLATAGNTYFNVMSPAVTRQNHLRAAGMHGAIVASIQKQLSMPPEMRQKADDYYSWIVAEQSNAVGSSPPLSAALLDSYPNTAYKIALQATSADRAFNLKRR